MESKFLVIYIPYGKLNIAKEIKKGSELIPSFGHLVVKNTNHSLKEWMDICEVGKYCELVLYPNMVIVRIK